MAHAIVQRERIEMRVDAETKRLAERAAAVCGYASTTAFISSLIHQYAPQMLQNEASIRLTNARFDRFIAACEDTERKPSQRILNAAKRLDAEGF